MRFFCIADKDSSLGFRLAGVETREVTTKAEAVEAFQVALATDEIGILVITEKDLSVPANPSNVRIGNSSNVVHISWNSAPYGNVFAYRSRALFEAFGCWRFRTRI